MREKTMAQMNPAMDLSPIRLLLCGIALYVVDVRIFGLSITPDCVGYALMFWGLHRMRMCVPMLLAGALCICTLPDLWQPYVLPVNVLVELSYPSLFIEVPCALLSVALVWTLSGTLRDLARQSHCPSLADDCTVMRLFYPVARLCVFLMPLVGLVALRELLVASVMTVGLMILGFSGEVFFFLLLCKTVYVPKEKR